MLSATLWTVGIVIIVLVIIGIPYIFGGYARYQVQGARSGMLPVADLSTPGLLECIAPTASLPSSTVKYGGSQVGYPVLFFHADFKYMKTMNN